MINIQELYHSPNGAKEELELTLEPSTFPELKLAAPVKLSAQLLRTDEGIVLLIQSIETQEKTHCTRCQKLLTLPLKTEASEWIFYEKNPREPFDENEIQRFDRNQFELDPRDVLRQEILMHLATTPHCKTDCIEFAEPDHGIKALAGLKDLFK